MNAAPARAPVGAGVLFAFTWLAACATAGAAGGTPPQEPPPSAVAAAVPQPPPAAPAAACPARVGADRLRRSAVVRTINAGLGTWLQTVSVDPKIDRGRFRGWIVRSLPSDDACFRDLDLRANDVVTRVNGRSVEHPEDAHAVWASLRTSPELIVDFTRDDQAHTLRFTIVDP